MRRRSVVTGGGKASADLPPFRAINTGLGNLKAVDIDTIRAWLGYVLLDTTHFCAEVDLERKAKALASVDITGIPIAPRADW